MAAEEKRADKITEMLAKLPKTMEDSIAKGFDRVISVLKGESDKLSKSRDGEAAIEAAKEAKSRSDRASALRSSIEDGLKMQGGFSKGMDGMKQRFFLYMNQAEKDSKTYYEKMTDSFKEGIKSFNKSVIGLIQGIGKTFLGPFYGIVAKSLGIVAPLLGRKFTEMLGPNVLNGMLKKITGVTEKVKSRFVPPAPTVPLLPPPSKMSKLGGASAASGAGIYGVGAGLVLDFFEFYKEKFILYEDYFDKILKTLKEEDSGEGLGGGLLGKKGLVGGLLNKIGLGGAAYGALGSAGGLSAGVGAAAAAAPMMTAALVAAAGAAGYGVGTLINKYASRMFGSKREISDLLTGEVKAPTAEESKKLLDKMREKNPEWKKKHAKELAERDKKNIELQDTGIIPKNKKPEEAGKVFADPLKRYSAGMTESLVKSQKTLDKDMGDFTTDNRSIWGKIGDSLKKAFNAIGGGGFLTAPGVSGPAVSGAGIPKTPPARLPEQGIDIASILTGGKVSADYLNIGGNRWKAQTEGVQPELKEAVAAAAKEYYEVTKRETGKGIKTTITEGVRTDKQQAMLKGNNRYITAKPGMSMHQEGLGYAMDIDSAQANDMAKRGILAKHGLTQPYGSKDPVHLELARLATAEKRAALRNAARQGKPINTSAPSGVYSSNAPQVRTETVKDNMNIAVKEPSRDNNNLAVAPAPKPQVTNQTVEKNITAPPPAESKAKTPFEMEREKRLSRGDERIKKGVFRPGTTVTDRITGEVMTAEEANRRNQVDREAFIKDRNKDPWEALNEATAKPAPNKPKAEFGAFVKKGGEALLHPAEIVSPISKFTEMLSKTATNLAQPAVTAAAAPSMMEGKAIEYLAAIAVGITKLTTKGGLEQPAPNNPAVPDTPGDPGIIFGGNYFPQKGRQWG